MNSSKTVDSSSEKIIKMKFIATTLSVLIAIAVAGPISISDNNIGEIVTVGINANAVLTSEINQNILSVIAAIMNQQAIGAPSKLENKTDDPVELLQEKPTDFNIPPKLIEKGKNIKLAKGQQLKIKTTYETQIR